MYSFITTGGNQRELARAKNAKKQQEQAKAKGSGTDFQKRKEKYVVSINFS